MSQLVMNSRNKARVTGRIRPEVWAVTSGKGGVGKSNLSVNMAYVLAKSGRRVLLIDADIHLGNVDLIMGIRTEFTITDVLKGTKNLKDIIVRVPGAVDILPAASAVADLLETKQNTFRDIIASYSRFQQSYDIVLVDTAAGISPQVLSFVFSANKSIVVATPDPASLTDAYGMIKIIMRNKPDATVMLVLNYVLQIPLIVMGQILNFGLLFMITLVLFAAIRLPKKHPDVYAQAKKKFKPATIFITSLIAIIINIVFMAVLAYGMMTSDNAKWAFPMFMIAVIIGLIVYYSKKSGS